MRCLPNANRSWQFVCCLALLLPIVSCSAFGESTAGFRVHNAEMRLEDGLYLLDASIEFGFSDESIEAMENGVKLTVLLDVEVLKKYLFWKRAVLQQQSRYRIGVHALSKRYVVRNLDTGEIRTFRTLEEMVAGLGMVSDLPLFDENFLSEDLGYTARVRARLDVEALPSPLRALAYISPDWRLHGDWYEWPLSR